MVRHSYMHLELTVSFTLAKPPSSCLFSGAPPPSTGFAYACYCVHPSSTEPSSQFLICLFTPMAGQIQGLQIVLYHWTGFPDDVGGHYWYLCYCSSPSSDCTELQRARVSAVLSAKSPNSPWKRVDTQSTDIRYVWWLGRWGHPSRLIWALLMLTLGPGVRVAPSLITVREPGFSWVLSLHPHPFPINII